MPAKLRLAASLCVGCTAAAPRPAPARPTPPPPAAPVLATVIRCDGTPMYPGPDTPAAVVLEIQGQRPLGDAVVELTVDGGPARRLRAAFAVEQRWRRRGFDATLVGTLIAPTGGANVGALWFSESIRENTDAMPSEDQILRGRPILFLATPADTSAAFHLECTPPAA